MPTDRIERDSLGELPVPSEAYFGIQTARALANFPISGLHAPASLVTATVLIKKAAADANTALQRLSPAVGAAITRAADEVLSGRLREHFVVDVYQAGAGTSHNMNANEVLANRAEEILGGGRGEYRQVHPNDHVNMSQSTNDVFPTATRVALLLEHEGLAVAARELAASLARVADASQSVLKVGRTHLQDAVPMTLGQEFGGYAACIERARLDADHAAEALTELNLGATAVGTGLNAGDDYATLAVAALSRFTGLTLSPATNRFRVTQSMGDVLSYSGALRRLAVELSKIASDLRLLSMGPRAGLSEIVLPAVQPGSSIMPGGRGRAARAERDDAGHRLERAARVGDPSRGDEVADGPVRRRNSRRRRPLPRAAGAQHGRGHSAQSLHRVREDGGARRRGGAERTNGSRSRGGAAAAHA
jgi:aspartate ammonia-lyase